MIIHVVQTGDTLEAIAVRYNISVIRLLQDNGLKPELSLVPGQTIVIIYPVQTYTVQEGDTLAGIANTNGISLIQLLRNNPFLSDREYIYTGETLVTQYSHDNGKITINGITTVFIDRKVLKKTLPFLTYLSIFGYRTTANADIISVEDEDLIQIAKDYGVAPILFLSALTIQGVGSEEVAYNVLYNPKLVDRFINNILNSLKEKGFYGLNITFQFINPDNIKVYNDFCEKLTNVLNKEGFAVFITFSPRKIYDTPKLTFEKIDYSSIGQQVNGTMFLSFNFGYSFGPPEPVVSLKSMKEFYDYAIQLIPPEKITVGLPIIGYNWQLPYVAGITKANSLTIDSAIGLAREVNSVIQFEEMSQTPFYNYTESALPIKHIVWFVDARSVDETVKLIPAYGFHGIGIWNIMYFYSQMWSILNSQYEIETVI